MSGDLLPCPFCGSNGERVGLAKLAKYITVQCGDCEASGPWTRFASEASADEAIEGWNTRAASRAFPDHQAERQSVSHEARPDVPTESPQPPSQPEPIATGDELDAKRLDWIARQDLRDLSFGVVVDAPRDGDYFVNSSGVIGYGKTFRDAIDAAIAKGEQHE